MTLTLEEHAYRKIHNIAQLKRMPRLGSAYCMWMLTGWEILYVERIQYNFIEGMQLEYEGIPKARTVNPDYPGMIRLRRMMKGGTFGAVYWMAITNWPPDSHLYPPPYVLQDEYEREDIERIIPLLAFIPQGDCRLLSQSFYRRMIKQSKRGVEKNGKPSASQGKRRLRGKSKGATRGVQPAGSDQGSSEGGTQGRLHLASTDIDDGGNDTAGAG